MSIQTAGVVPDWQLQHRLKRAREHAQMEQGDLAEAIGTSRTTIGNAERGTHTPRRSLVMAWAMATGVNLQWLETGTAPSPDGDGASGEYTPWDSNPEPSDSRCGLVLSMVRAA